MTRRQKVGSVLAFLVFFALPFGLIIAGSDSQSTTVTKSNFSASPSEQKTQPASSRPSAEKSSQLLIGNPEAKVTIIEYADFQCPFCGQFFRQTEPKLLETYIDTGLAKIDFRIETHIGEESVRAGEAAYCANDQSAFKPYHDELFRRQNGENDGAFSNANLKKIASDLRLNTEQFGQCLDSQKYLTTVQDSHNAAKQNGISATPTIIIGSHRVSGAQPSSLYKPLIDEQL